jgi:hypothetical protein
MGQQMAPDQQMAQQMDPDQQMAQQQMTQEEVSFSKRSLQFKLRE